MVLRVLVVAASVGAFAGAVLLRLREHAGEIDLEAEIAARARDEARFEDRAAELEFQAETAEEQVKRLERRLLAQRAQLTRIEAENSRLLRERARAAAEQAAREADEARRKELAACGNRPTPTAYLKASAALRGLERRAAVGQAQRIAAQAGSAKNDVLLTPVQPAPTGSALDALATARQLDAAAAAAPSLPEDPAAPDVADIPDVAAAPAAVASPARQHPGPDAVASTDAASTAPASTAPAKAAQPSAPVGPAWARAALPPMRPASAVLPTALTRTGRQSRDLLSKDDGSSGTFNFFSRQEAAISTSLGDLADVVGDEAAAAQQRYAGEPGPAGDAPVDGLPDPVHDRSATAAEVGAAEVGIAEDGIAEVGAGEAEAADGGESELVVDLTTDDETEPIDVRILRAI